MIFIQDHFQFQPQGQQVGWGIPPLVLGWLSWCLCVGFIFYTRTTSDEIEAWFIYNLELYVLHHTVYCILFIYLFVYSFILLFKFNYIKLMRKRFKLNHNFSFFRLLFYDRWTPRGVVWGGWGSVAPPRKKEKKKKESKKEKNEKKRRKKERRNYE